MVIVGPTAVGKTELSIQLAERLGGEIVSADSRLFYRGMDIGTAKPTLQERRWVPHHLIDVAEPDETWSLALFQRQAYLAIQSIQDRNRLPFLVGGTGQFIHSITEGWSIPPSQPDTHLRNALTDWAASVGTHALHAKLALLDPQAAQSIDPSNVRRTIRAMEVILSTGRRFSDQKRKGEIRYNSLLIGLSCPREQLYQRIDRRITNMLASGFVEEVQQLLARGFSPQLPTLSAIGYGEIISYLQGKISLDEAVTLMKRRTRVFVRRQSNWFKENDPNIHWFPSGEEALPELEMFIRQWLKQISAEA